MKILSLFNNKGGVGKTTLTYHLAHILATPVAQGGCGKKVLMMDLDPQSNLTIYSIQEDAIGEMWEAEKPFIEDGVGYSAARAEIESKKWNELLERPRTLHFLLRPTEEGESDEDTLPPPYDLNNEKTLGIIPGRLSMYKYESVLAQRWSSVYLAEPLSIRTISKIRNLAKQYADKYNYDYVIMDTSPSLGVLNKVIIGMADGFIIPCFPDLFSLYGIKNIGGSLEIWKKEFHTMLTLIAPKLGKDFPSSFVQFLGYTIFNARKYDGNNKWGLSKAHYNYARKFPAEIETAITIEKPVPNDLITMPIGDTAIMYSHNTFPNLAQKYKHPMWLLPDLSDNLLSKDDSSTIKLNKEKYKETKQAYFKFATDLLSRIEYLDKKDSNAK